MKKIAIILFLVITNLIFGQMNYLNEGNKFLSQDKNIEAEKMFREGIKSDDNDLILKCQLALSLINQNKFDEAENEITKILLIDSLNLRKPTE